MRVACLGGGPAGLYLAISLKRRQPAHEVVVVERNRPSDTFGWGVVLSNETLDNLDRNDAESTAEQIDAEVQRIMTDAHETARRILTEHRGNLESVTQRLLEKEVMEGEELRKLLGFPTVPAEPTPSPATL